LRSEKFTISGELPDLNTIIDEAKRGWQPYSRLKEVNTDRVAWTCKKLKPFNKIDVDIEWICKEKRKDKDNVMVGTKFILDGLVKAKVIKNDGWKEIGEIRHSFYTDKESPHINVILTEVGK